MTASNPQNILTVFASGKGSNTQKIIDYFRHHPSIHVGLIVCNNSRAGVLEIAEKEHIPTLLINRKTLNETGYLEELRQYKTDWIILAGFLLKIPPVLVKAYPAHIINIHPALLPAYGGRGMYGMAVHTAVVNAGEPKSGITIHFVDEEYDHGKTILQQTVALEKGETPDSLAAKIHVLEYRHFAPAIEKAVMGR